MILLVVAAVLGVLWYMGYLQFHDPQESGNKPVSQSQSLGEMTRVVNGVAMLPMREAFEALDADVHYDAKHDLAVAVLPGGTVKIRPGAERATIGGEPFRMTRPSKVIDGTLYVTRRFVEEATGPGRDLASID